MELRPTFSSFVSSSLYRLSGLVVAAIFIFFTYEEATAFDWFLDVAMALFSLWCFLPCLPVHLQKLQLDEYGIRLSGLFGVTAIPWESTTSATLRERANAVSRTDRLLIVRGPDGTIVFPTSTLREGDEKCALEIVRRHVNLVVQRDKATI